MQVSFSTGDKTAILLKAHTAHTKTVQRDIIKELTGGEHSDIARRVDGNFRTLSGIENLRSDLLRYQKNADFVSGSFKSQSSVLNAILTDVSGFHNAMIEYGGTDSISDPKALMDDAFDILNNLSHRLNSKFSGLSQFAGSAVETEPYESGATILRAFSDAMEASRLSGADIGQAANAWFSDEDQQNSENFAAFAFRGHRGGNQNIRIGQFKTVDMYVDPLSKGIVDAFKGASLIALGAKHLSEGQDDLSGQFLHAGSAALARSKAGLTSLIAEVGDKQQRLDVAAAENAAWLSSATISRNDLRQVDDYAKISELDEVEARLEAIYSLTARISKLNLLDFLR